MRTAFTLVVCALWLALCQPTGADDLAGALVQQAGSDLLGYLRIENPKSLLGKLDTVSAKFGGRVSDDLPLIAQRCLKNPLLAGIDTERPWTFVFLNPQRHTNNLAVVVGVSDGAVFCDSFGKGGVSGVKADPATAGAAVRHFSETEEAYDHAAYVAALRIGKKVEPLQFKKQVAKQYYVTVRNNEGVIVGDAALLDKLPPAAASLGQDRVRGDIEAAVHAPNILALYEKEIRQRRDSVLEAVRAGAPATASGDETARLGRTLRANFDVALSLARQVAWIEAAVEFDSGRLKLRLAAPPLPGSGFSRALVGQQPREADTRLMAMLPPDVAMLGAVRFTKTPEWTGFLLEMMRPIIEACATNSAAGSAAQLQATCRAAVESRGDAFALAVLTPATNQTTADLVEVVRVADAARARQAQRKAVEARLPLSGAGAQPEIAGKTRYESNVARHAGVEIDRVTVELPAVADAQVGSSLVQHLAFAGQFELIAQGPRATNSIRRLIAAVKTPPVAAGAPRFKAATASLPSKHNGIFYLNLAEYFGLVRSAMFPASEDPQMRQLQTLLADAKADVAGCLLLQPRAPVVELVVPLDKLVEVFSKKVAVPPATP